jgi:hypothetical protein
MRSHMPLAQEGIPLLGLGVSVQRKDFLMEALDVASAVM